VIVGGSEKERFKLYLVRTRLFSLISKKQALKHNKKLFRALNSLIHFSLPLTKEKSLYNTVFTKNLETGGVT